MSVLLISLLAGINSACARMPTFVQSSPAPSPSRSTPGTTIPRSAAVQPTPTAIPVPTKVGWRLVFDDEFNGSKLDTHKWSTQYWWGRTNPPEMQFYAPDAFTLQRGLLRIEAQQRSVQGFKYTSGLITSRESFQFTYGYAEFRGRVPAGQGLWPAFWLLASDRNSSAEIDVMEILGDAPNRVHVTLHYDDAQKKRQQEGDTFEGPDFSKDFHTFAVDWNPTAVVWYVDDVEQFRLTHDVPQESMYLLANLAVGGDWPGYPDSTTRFPAFFDIDYIRVYQR